MLKINVTIQAPELAAAIASLAAAMSGASFVTPATPAPVAAVPAAPAALPADPATVVAAPAAPAVAPVQPPAPIQPPAAPPVAAAPTCSRDQIMTAGAALIDAGKINELMGLLSAFGVQAVTQLKQEQLGAFATELQKMGAQI